MSNALPDRLDLSRAASTQIEYVVSLSLFHVSVTTAVITVPEPSGGAGLIGVIACLRRQTT